MKNKQLIVMILIALFAIPSSSMAQNRVKRPATKKTAVNRNKRTSSTPQKATGDAKINLKLPIAEFMLDGDIYKVPGTKANVTVYDFGEEGKTVIMEIKWSPEQAQYMPSETQVYSYSGNLKISPAKQINAGLEDGYFFERGKEVCGAIAKTQRGWTLGVYSNERVHLVNDLFPGMTLAQVETKMKGELGKCQFKETGKSGGYTIYTLYWLDQRKSYHWDGDYHYTLTNDKAYARFFFDSNSKLHKLIIYY